VLVAGGTKAPRHTSTSTLHQIVLWSFALSFSFCLPSIHCVSLHFKQRFLIRVYRLAPEPPAHPPQWQVKARLASRKIKGFNSEKWLHFDAWTTLPYESEVTMNPVTILDIVTGLRAGWSGVRLPGEARDVSFLQKCSDRLWVPSVFLCIEYPILNHHGKLHNILPPPHPKLCGMRFYKWTVRLK